MDPTDHEDIAWLHTQVRLSPAVRAYKVISYFFVFHQLTGHVNGLSGIYERISYTIQDLQDDKVALQNRIEELEQDNPSAEVRRLRDENAVLHARLATTTKEKSEITWERDALLRKLNSIKQLIDGPAVRSPPPSVHSPISPTLFTAQFDAIDISTDAPPPNEPGPTNISRSSTVRPQQGNPPVRTTLALTQQSGPASAAGPTSPISEPRTDLTVVNDSFGRVIQPGVYTPHPPQATAAAPSSDGPREASQPLSTHTSTTLVDTRNRSQDAAPRYLGAPFVDARSSPSTPQTPPTHRVRSGDLTGSPVRRFLPGTARILSLSTSPRTSEGLSMQYEMTPPRTGTGSSGEPADTTSSKTQKWKIHFAKPPKSAMVTRLAKPVTTATLVRNLELDEDAVRVGSFILEVFLEDSSSDRATIETFHRGVRT